MNLSDHNYNRYLKRWKSQFTIYADLMKVSLALVAEIKPGELITLAYTSLADNTIFFNKDISHSICKTIIDRCEPQQHSNLQLSATAGTLEARAGIKFFYGVPVLNEKGKVFATLCTYSKELSYMEEEKLIHINTIKSLIEEDIFYSHKELSPTINHPADLPSNDQKLQHFLRFSPVGIFYYNKQLIISGLNDRFAEMLKVNAATIVGMDMHDIYDKRVLPAILNALLGIESEYEGEYHTTSSNTSITILLKTAPVYAGEKIVGGIGVLQDISVKTNIAKALAKSENKYRELVEKINDVIYSIDTNGIFTYVSPVAKLLTGYTPEELSGHDLAEFIHKDDNLIYNNAIKEVKLGSTIQSEIRIKGKSGSYTWIRNSMRPIYNENGAFAGIHGIAQDIEQTKLAERDLIAAKEKAEESDRLKSSFLANMSHEIRTPMNGIIGFSELLSSKTINPAEREYYTSIIVKSGHQLLDIINDVLEISKIETGQININNTDVNINYLIDVLYSFFRRKAEDKNLQLNTFKASEQSAFYITTDEGKLRQILNNLLSNAIKFTKAGMVSFGYYFADDNCIVFYVEDEGIGIAKGEQIKIFDRFTQANAEIMNQHGGTGLGLPISKSLVELLGGEIWLESELNKGSKFCFSLPCKKL
ncbi:PAS domain S-box-containing protein [Saccharicrinis carchari]|uniref:Sensory/regulatory protein RpfC n=1 Tax=Saccharicrinis carchari TaxID=1168039 RepID=A0A521B7H0_SACCC|nr:PAS domain-containing protein [Saccharicrinis carchari]SMO42951.1 PAS domain S-box-containing protein [Saccharicrinis carchari]